MAPGAAAPATQMKEEQDLHRLELAAAALQQQPAKRPRLEATPSGESTALQARIAELQRQLRASAAPAVLSPPPSAAATPAAPVAEIGRAHV